MSRNLANNGLMDGILAAFSVRHKCPINYSCRKRRFGEDLPYANICNLCGGYQRYKYGRLPVLHEDVDNSHEFLRFGELTINPTNSPDSCQESVEDAFMPMASEMEEMMGKLTFSQIEMMRGYADMIHWRIEDDDEEKLNEFCVGIDVSSEVFKTWLRNNNTMLVDGVNGPIPSYVESGKGLDGSG